ncbi:FKBP-type peptidyl-prolyl cis-trans isomerase [Streptomyces oceani]|uniref:Peptidyl-prolyl cis-trans isomerase n=1 Tax=Streptomyces oceani TaxID=1075402 RepID=A0A1E7KHC5_9ACTN|nr:FKBP-type peptidyl-prolyl cis-trans isomerase [Streptomyces oceani]OEV03281.1 hypothetical protein AN216_12050 [Streptomyces oceani]
MTASPRTRRATAALIVPLLIPFAAACGSEEPSKDGAIPAVSASAQDEKPKIDKGEGDPPKKLKTKVLKQGKGPKVRKGDVVNATYHGQLWNGKVFDTTWKKGGEPVSFQLGRGSVIPGWDEGLVGQRMGSRVELVVPPDKAYGNKSQGPIPKNSTLVFVVDLKKTLPNKVDGKPVEEPDPELPEVSTEITDKAPKIEVEKGAKAPKGVRSTTVLEGDGEEITSESTVLANFTAKLWNGEPFANSWQQTGPQDYPVKQMVGWEKGLEGKKQGSRVVISVPREEFPKKARAQIPSDVVFSVDVLSVK